MTGSELPHLGELDERAHVQNGHIWAVRAQHDGDPRVLHLGGDDAEVGIALDQLAQASREEIIKAGEHNGDGGM